MSSSIIYETSLMTCSTNRNTHRPRNFKRGTCLPSHHLPLPLKTSSNARFQGRLLFTTPPPPFTLEDKCVCLFSEVVATVYHSPLHLPFLSKTSTYACFRRRLFTPPPLHWPRNDRTFHCPTYSGRNPGSPARTARIPPGFLVESWQEDQDSGWIPGLPTRTPQFN